MYQRVKNVETGEVFERTPDAEWRVKLDEWREAMRSCGHNVTRCPVPSPMPYGHIMFSASLKRRGSLYQPVQ